MVKDITLICAFLSVAAVYPSVRHGKWIPVTYWAPKVGLKLNEKVNPQKLFKVLEKMHVTNREFTADDVQLYQNGIQIIIEKVESTMRRIIQEGKSTPSRVGFLFIATKTNPSESLPSNQTELSKFFQSRYDNYHQRRSILSTPALQTPMKESVPTYSTNAPPSVSKIYQSTNQDVLGLLQTIIRPEYLLRRDLLKDEDKCFDVFRLSVQKLGCALQTEANKVYYDILSRDRYDDNINIKDLAKYKPFLGRFCCPFSKRAGSETEFDPESDSETEDVLPDMGNLALYNGSYEEIETQQL